MIDILKRTLNENKGDYLDKLIQLVSIDTHCIDHGVGGGLEKKGKNI